MPTEYYGALSNLLAATTLISLLITGVIVAAMWMIFLKAGEEGWAAIIPFYNTYVLYKITWGNGWFFLLLFIPFANFVIMIITLVKLSKVFGRGGGWACGLIFLSPIFLCITGFSKNIQYVGINGMGAGDNGPAAYSTAGASYAASYQKQNPNYQSPYQPTQQQQSASNPQYHYQTTATDASSTTTTKFCSSCGSPLGENAKFCPKCGQKV